MILRHSRKDRRLCFVSVTSRTCARTRNDSIPVLHNFLWLDNVWSADSNVWTAIGYATAYAQGSLPVIWCSWRVTICRPAYPVRLGRKVAFAPQSGYSARISPLISIHGKIFGQNGICRRKYWCPLHSSRIVLRRSRITTAFTLAMAWPFGHMPDMRSSFDNREEKKE